MTTRKTTTPELRRCKGSARFGIEPHQAQVSDFPKQPSRKDGLGVMCTEHWRAYVMGLREARMTAVALVTADGDMPLSEAGAAKVTRVVRRTRRPAKPLADAEVAAAEALIAEVDALPGLEAVAAANGTTREMALGETDAA